MDDVAVSAEYVAEALRAPVHTALCVITKIPAAYRCGDAERTLPHREIHAQELQLPRQAVPKVLHDGGKRYAIQTATST